MVETLLVFPVALMIALWIIHIGLVYQARANLEYAALMGARIGAVTNLNIPLMRTEIANRMAPSQIGSTPVTEADISILVLNPTNTMFSDCGVVPTDSSVCGPGIPNCEIPNFGLQFRPADPVCDGVSIQDANVLRIQVSYNFDSKIPFMNMRLFPSDEGNVSTGTSVKAVATVRMQTSAIRSVDNYGVFL